MTITQIQNGIKLIPLVAKVGKKEGQLKTLIKNC